MNKMKKEIIITLLAASLIMLFIYTSFSKIFNYRDFKESMAVQPLPVWIISILLKTLPAIEIITSLLLIFPKTRLFGFWTSLILMISFTTYITLGLLNFFKRIPCS